MEKSELDTKYDQAAQKTVEAYKKYLEADEEEEILYLQREALTLYKDKGRTE